MSFESMLHNNGRTAFKRRNGEFSCDNYYKKLEKINVLATIINEFLNCQLSVEFRELPYPSLFVDLFVSPPCFAPHLEQGGGGVDSTNSTDGEHPSATNCAQSSAEARQPSFPFPDGATRKVLDASGDYLTGKLAPDGSKIRGKRRETILMCI